MGSKNFPFLLLLKLIILFLIIIISFSIFNELLDLPWEANTLWTNICWYFITLLLFFVFFFFGDRKFSFNSIHTKITAIKTRGILLNFLYFGDLLLNSFFIAFFIFVLSAYYTMYFASIPFTEDVTIVRVKCKEYSGGFYALLPAYTNLHFVDNQTEKTYSLTFRDNMCKENPETIASLPGKKAALSGRLSFFGKFYDHIQLI